MNIETLTLRSIRARPVLLPLKRPIVVRIATIDEWPVILIDLETEEGVTGRAYLGPYLSKAKPDMCVERQDREWQGLIMPSIWAQRGRDA
jgi:hypothetical protein